MTNRKIVIPGEIIETGEDYLPGEGTEKRKNEIIALRFGLTEEYNKLVKVIPLSGVYHPRRGNVVIGKVEHITFNGWVVDIKTADNGFIPVSEVPRYVNKNDLGEVMDLGDMVVAKISEINQRGTDLTIMSRGLGRLDDGMIIEINSNRVPRVIGKEGSMINLIKDATQTEITVGQNGKIWIKGSFEGENKAEETINLISRESASVGLTEKVEKFLGEKK